MRDGTTGKAPAGPHSEEQPDEPERTTPERWRLVDTRPAAGAPLAPYEQALLDAIFAGRTERTVGRGGLQPLSALRQVRDELAAAAVARGWLDEQTFVTRCRTGGLIAFAGCATAGIVSKALGLDAVFAVCGVGGAAGLAASVYPSYDRPLRRTPAGDAALAGLAPYRDQLATAGGRGIRPGSAAELFSRSLPYAVALGVGRSWATRFADLIDVPPWAETGDWYRPAGPDADLRRVTRNLPVFIGAMNSPPPVDAPSPRGQGDSHSLSWTSSGTDIGSSSWSSSSGDSGASSSSGGGGSW